MVETNEIIRLETGGDGMTFDLRVEYTKSCQMHLNGVTDRPECFKDNKLSRIAEKSPLVG